MQNREFVVSGGRAVDVFARAKMAAGAALIAAGVLVAVFPQILVFLLSTLVVSAGLGLLLSGWRTRRAVTRRTVSQSGPRVEDFFDR